MKFNEDMSMGEILAANPNARAVLEGFGMHCCGCPMSQAEALGDACDVHGVDVNLVLEELNNLSDDFGCGCGCCGGDDCCCDDDCDCDYDEDEYDDCDCCCGEDCDCDDDCDCGCQDK